MSLVNSVVGDFRSATTASLDDHVVIIFEDDLVILVDVEHGDGGELGRDATRPRHGSRVHRVHQRLHDCVIRGVEVIGQRERAVALAVVGVVARWGDDPVVPADVAKVDVERMASAIVPAALALVLLLGGALTPHAGLAVVRVRHQ